MTKPKYAALTAGLLARKGEAMPSAHSAFMQAQAFAQVAQPAEHPAQKTPAPQDLAALIERAPRLAAPALPQPETPPAAAVAPEPQPEPQPQPQLQPQPFQLLRGGLPPAPQFGLRGRTAPAAALPRPAAPVSGDVWSAVQRMHRTAVTVRLNETRYLRLKLTALRYQRTYQDILTRALDVYLTALGIDEIDDESAPGWRARLSGLLSR